MSVRSSGVSHVDSLEEITHSSWLKRAIANVSENATTANLIGLLGGIAVLFCLLVLPSSQYWNLRLPLYMVVVIWTLLRPRVALYLLPIAVPWGSLDTINVGLNLTSADILVALLAASWLMSYVMRPLIPQEALHTGLFDREEFNVPRYLVLAMVALLLTMLLSMTTTFSLTSSLKELSKWLELVTVILLGVQYIRTRHQIWTLVVIICLAAISQAFLGYIQYFFNLGPASFVRSDSLRVYGTFDQPNPYAGYIDMTLTLVIALTLLAGNWKTRILAGLTTVLLAPMIVPPIWLTQSKGGIVAFTVALLFIVTLGMPHLRKLIGAGTIAVLAFVAAYLAGRVPDRLFAPILRILGLIDISFTAPTSQDFATAERVAHWIAGIRMFLDHPWLGVGIGSYPDAYPKYFITIFVNPLGHAHNYYINIAAE
ncbi:MAG: O-antigen ligase family protein, partial [Chloroflexi bacterium]|nr:O-antigen ligase family protein [Chloroflexota bacterium]